MLSVHSCSTKKDLKAKVMKPSDYIRQGWIQGRYAQDSKGRGVTAGASDAVAWCLAGALIAFDGKHKGPAYCKVQSVIGFGFPAWNDAQGRTKEQVLALLESLGL